jgi:hypothetical protein
MKLTTESLWLKASNWAESISEIPRGPSDISNTLNDRLFVQAIMSTVNVTHTDCIRQQCLGSTLPQVTVSATAMKPKSKLTPEQIARYWNVGLEATTK